MNVLYLSGLNNQSLVGVIRQLLITEEYMMMVQSITTVQVYPHDYRLEHPNLGQEIALLLNKVILETVLSYHQNHALANMMHTLQSKTFSMNLVVRDSTVRDLIQELCPNCYEIDFVDALVSKITRGISRLVNYLEERYGEYFFQAIVSVAEGYYMLVPVVSSILPTRIELAPNLVPMLFYHQQGAN